jgi:hypothetical protein
MALNDALQKLIDQGKVINERLQQNEYHEWKELCIKTLQANFPKAIGMQSIEATAFMRTNTIKEGIILLSSFMNKEFSETLKFDAPKPEAPKAEPPKAEAPAYDMTRYQTPKYDSPKYEAELKSELLSETQKPATTVVDQSPLAYFEAQVSLRVLLSIEHSRELSEDQKAAAKTLFQQVAAEVKKDKPSWGYVTELLRKSLDYGLNIGPDIIRVAEAYYRSRM